MNESGALEVAEDVANGERRIAQAASRWSSKVGLHAHANLERI